MMPILDRNRLTLHISLLIIVIFIVGRLWGDTLFDNNWSFNHWKYLPTGYLLLWFLFLVSIALFFTLLGKRIAIFFNSRLKAGIALAVVLGLLILFQFDSFLYSGGNLRIAQIAQTEHVIFRWFEYGTIMIVSWLDTFFNLFDIHYNTAGVYAWKVFSFGCVILSLIGALKLAQELTVDAARRFYLFIILFFGPHTILHFGFVGVEPIVVTVSIWFTLLAVRMSNCFTTNRLLAMWGILLVGLFMHYTLIYLLPAAIYTTVKSHGRQSRSHTIAVVAALVSYVGLLILTYYWAGRNMEFARSVLFLAGKLPHSDYGLFSPRHLGDILQIVFLAFPQFIIVVYFIVIRRHPSRNNGNSLFSLLLVLGGTTVVFIMDPSNSIVFDFPRLAAYLFPLSFVLAMLLNEYELQKSSHHDRVLAILAAICLIFPLSYLPNYLRIAKADPYVTDYLEKHESFYMQGCLAFRDAYFYRKELDQANAWEWKLPRVSHDYLNLEGAKSLSMQGQDAEALRTLHKVIVQNPYWSDARSVFVGIQMKMGRYHLAKPQIDTCLMLEPFRKEYMINLYRYYRDIQNYPEALKSIKRTLKLFPGDNDIKTDLMVVHYRSGAYLVANSLADTLLATDSTLPYPYLIKGLLAEIRKDPQAAITHYKKFITLAPNEPDTPPIQERLNELIWEMEEE